MFEIFSGIRNVLVLFCAVMTEHKILFHSSSYSRLTEGCRALTALMYPFKYTHVNIPLLPAALIDFLDTPTPFIMGVHSSLKHEVAELVSNLWKYISRFLDKNSCVIGRSDTYFKPVLLSSWYFVLELLLLIHDHYTIDSSHCLCFYCLFKLKWNH